MHRQQPPQETSPQRWWSLTPAQITNSGSIFCTNIDPKHRSGARHKGGAGCPGRVWQSCEAAAPNTNIRLLKRTNQYRNRNRGSCGTKTSLMTWLLQYISAILHSHNPRKLFSLNLTGQENTAAVTIFTKNEQKPLFIITLIMMLCCNKHLLKSALLYFAYVWSSSSDTANFMHVFCFFPPCGCS